MRGIVAVLVSSALLSAPAALAAPHVEFTKPLPGVTTNGQLVAGPDGNIWVALDDAVARVTPDGTVDEFKAADLDNKLAFPFGGIATAGGAIWVSQAPAGVDPIVKITPGNPPTATGFAIANITAGATAMTVGPDGNLWVAFADTLVKFPPSNPTASTKYTITNMQAKGLTASSDGTLWVSDTSGTGQLLNITTNGTLVHPAYPTGSAPQFLAAGTNGQVTVALPNAIGKQQIGQLVPGGTVQTLDRPNGTDPFGVAFGIDGAFWVAEFAANRLERVTADGSATTLTGFPTDVTARGPRQITAGPNNTLWTTLDHPGDDPMNPQAQIAKISGLEPPPTPGGGGGQPPGGNTPPPDTTAPAVNAVKLTKVKVPAGTATITLRFTVTETGSATIVISRRLPGRRHGGKCVKPTTKLRRAKRCTRLVRLKTVQVATTAGANSVKLRIKTLSRGSYGVALTAADAAGNRAVSVTRTLTVTKRRSGT